MCRRGDRTQTMGRREAKEKMHACTHLTYTQPAVQESTAEEGYT